MFQHVVRTPRVWQVGGGLARNHQSSLWVTMHANATLTPLMGAKLVQHHLTTGASLRATATVKAQAVASDVRHVIRAGAHPHHKKPPKSGRKNT